MKKLSPLLWLAAALLLYVLSSVPAVQLLDHTRASCLLIIYRPLSYLAAYTPASLILIRYWNFFIQPDDNPLYLG
jgi:hypothetical protein